MSHILLTNQQLQCEDLNEYGNIKPELHHYLIIIVTVGTSSEIIQCEALLNLYTKHNQTMGTQQLHCDC